MGTAPNTDNEFPWHIGVYDAHCHPTDIMSNIPSIPRMNARCLTVMSTRAQDQHLVAQVADQYGISSEKHNEWKREECIVPCFGWHPWFAHMMYLDDPSASTGKDPEPSGSTGGNPEPSSSTGEDPESLQGDHKINHYASVLAPKREPLSETDRQTFLSLPDPAPFSVFLSQTRQNLERYPYALVGEIGLDRAFRVPEPHSQADRPDPSLTPGTRDGRKLTPFRCTPAHQKEIFKQQLMLAAEMGRGVSAHGVQAHGLVFDAIKELWVNDQLPVLSRRERKKRGNDDPSVASQLSSSQYNNKGGARKPYPPRICLHSYSGSPDAFKQYLNPAIPVSFFASFSTAINLGDDLDGETPEAFKQMIRAVPDDMVLVESDLHTAGEEMDKRLEDISRRICAVKGWGVEEGVERLGKNWRRFVFGEE